MGLGEGCAAGPGSAWERCLAAEQSPLQDPFCFEAEAALLGCSAVGGKAKTGPFLVPAETPGLQDFVRPVVVQGMRLLLYQAAALADSAD